MSDRAYGRRTVLEVLGTLAAIALASLFGTATSVRDGSGPPGPEPPGREGGGHPPREATGPPFATSSDAAIAIVDRIVDGRFVVILVESEDRAVLETDDPILPGASECDALLSWFDDEGDLVAVERLPGESRRRRRNRNRFDELSERPNGSAGASTRKRPGGSTYWSKPTRIISPHPPSPRRYRTTATQAIQDFHCR
ncbi:hypothetical protein [Saliphagus infecundisoli]|uniref:Uncharacterized protein n=1 Tax=Saliphagus infecundisoli TaxID=1849069 RepID=A0ABD5QJX7_9EURY|nr:hypothetical protein [Saliphagus infecundisoli]